MLTKKRLAFTMIELIFVIVILGILAAVAIPKLSATRNDAKIATEMTSAAVALSNLGAEFTAKGAFVDYTIANADNSVICFKFVLDDATDGNFSLSVGAVSTTCPDNVRTSVILKAFDKGMVNVNGVAKKYSLGGIGILE